MGQSIAPLAEGFLAHEPQRQSPERPKPAFCGIICTHTGSRKHESLLADALAPVAERFGVPFLGCLGRNGAPQIPLSHLGLVQAGEMELPDEGGVAHWFNCDTSKLDFGLNPARAVRTAKKPKGPVIAGARDAAFSFCYADLPDLLQSFGARCVFFSPLSDGNLPACDGIYLPGGYPELYGPQLAANTAMLSALKAFSGPIYGKCGGYVYFMESIIGLDGQK